MRLLIFQTMDVKEGMFVQVCVHANLCVHVHESLCVLECVCVCVCVCVCACRRRGLLMVLGVCFQCHHLCNYSTALPAQDILAFTLVTFENEIEITRGQQVKKTWEVRRDQKMEKKGDMEGEMEG